MNASINIQKNQSNEIENGPVVVPTGGSLTPSGTGIIQATTLPKAATASGITMSTGKLLGRTTALAGSLEEITVGTGLTLAGGILSQDSTADQITIGTTIIPPGGTTLVLDGVTGYNGLALTALASGFTVAGGTVSKTLTVAASINTGTTNGTLGSAAFTASSAYVPAYAGLTTNGLLQATAATTVASTLTPAGLTSLGVNGISSAALSNLTLGTGTFGTALTFASATGIPTFAALTIANGLLQTNGTGIVSTTLTPSGLTSIGASSFLGAILDSNAATDTLIKRNGTTGITLGASSLTTLVGNLTVSGTGTSSFAGQLNVNGATPTLRIGDTTNDTGAVSIFLSNHTTINKNKIVVTPTGGNGRGTWQFWANSTNDSNDATSADNVLTLAGGAVTAVAPLTVSAATPTAYLRSIVNDVGNNTLFFSPHTSRNKVAIITVPAGTRGAGSLYFALNYVNDENNATTADSVLSFEPVNKVATFGSTTSGTSTTAAAILGKSLGLTENLWVGGTGNFAGVLTTIGGATFHTTSSALTNGAGVAAGTLLNAPAAGNPTKWIGINDNGTTRYIPAW